MGVGVGLLGGMFVVDRSVRLILVCFCRGGGGRLVNEIVLFGVLVVLGVVWGGGVLGFVGVCGYFVCLLSNDFFCWGGLGFFFCVEWDGGGLVWSWWGGGDCKVILGFEFICVVIGGDL